MASELKYHRDSRFNQIKNVYTFYLWKGRLSILVKRNIIAYTLLIKPETSLQAKTAKLKLFFGHIMRKQGSLKKAIMLGQIIGSRKRERPEYEVD